MRPRIGIIDSGVSESLFCNVAESRRFGELSNGYPAQPDNIAHGDQLAKLILRQSPESELLIAQVFYGENRSPLSRIVDALDWLTEMGVQIINMSFGLSTPAVVLNEACKKASLRGALLVASAPATGGLVFPAALPECLAVTGDARCSANEISWLGLPHAELGACPMISPSQVELGGGASFACARVTGFAARLIAKEGIPTLHLLEHLRRNACYVGPEVRQA